MKIRARRRGSRARKVSGLLRVLCVLVLACFFGQTTVAWAFPCGHVDESGESCPDQGGKKNCPCPIDCGPCCAGNALPAIPPTLAVLVAPAALFVELGGPVAQRAPPPSESSEILRVPKPPRA